ncbi:MAG TPA: PAS domain S-box protein, partial [Thermoanaerobaculia bacterium]|nr:PAS domain S-box protein [Thermoanaerobaculia bacterium]
KEFVVERERVLETGIPAKREVSFPVPTGERWFEYVISPLIDESGRRHGVLAVSRDVTSRIAMERELHAELRFRHTIERSLSPGLATIDLTGRITYVSESFEKMVGFTLNDLRGSRAPYPHWPPEEQPLLLGRIDAMRRGATLPRRAEVTFMRRSGERFPAVVETSPLVDEKGATIGWLAVVTDVTEQQRIAAAVAESDRRYRDLADSMPQIVWSARADGTAEYLNARWYEFSGFPEGAVDWMSIIHADDRERTIEAWQRSVATGEPFQIEYRFFDRARNGYRWHLGRALPVRDDSGRVVRWYGTATDIEDLKEAQTAVQRQNVFLKTLLDISQVVSAELDLHKLVQAVTDAATKVIGAQFGAFFYNVIDDRGESYTLYTISGVPREAFSRFPMPRNTEVFGPTFRGTSIVRSDNIREDPRYGKNPPYYGMPKGHLPVVSYLAVPVISKSSGRVLGGLFFGHSSVGVFTEDAERLIAGIAAQAAIAMDNANLLEQARRAEERYRTLVSAMSQVVWSADTNGKVVAGTGAEAAAIEASAAEWASRMHGDAPFDIEQRVRMADGSFRWFAIRGFPVTTGGESREWIGTATDIDDRKRGEEAASFLVDASAVLNSSLDAETILSRLGTLAVPRLADWCAIDVVQPGGNRKRVVVAHSDPEKRNMAIELDRDYPPDPRQDPITEVARSGKSQLVESIPEGYLEARTRGARHLELVRALGLRSWIIVPIKAGGNIAGTLTLVSAESARRFTSRDLAVAEHVAERAGMAVYNAQLYREAQDANRAKDEFLATLSHELRTPMTAILGWARLVNMGAADEPTTREAIESIEKSARAQSQLIDDLLDISRIGVGKLHLEIEAVDLQEIVRSAVDAVRPAANAKRVELEMALGDERPHVSGDANRLQQVVWNLVSNAVKFTPSGGRVLVTMS